MSRASLKFGEVTKVDAAKARVRVRFADLGIESYWLPVLVSGAYGDTEYRLPVPKTQVVALMDERLESGVVLGAVYSDAQPPPLSDPRYWQREFEDGTVLKYDKTAHKLTATVKGPIEATAETGDAVVAALVGDVRATSILGAVTAAGRRVDAIAAETATLMAGEKVTIGAPEVEIVGAGGILLSSPLITSLSQWVFTALGFIWNAAADWTVNVVGVLSQSAGTMFLNAALKMKLYAFQELEMETDLLKVSARRVELVASDPAAPLDITTTGTARLTSTDGDIEFKTPKGAFKVNGKVVPEA